MLRKIRANMSDLNHTRLGCLDPNALHRDRRIMVYFQKNRRVNYTDRRGRSREIQLGISRRTERGTRLAIEWYDNYIGDDEPCTTGSMKTREGGYKYSKTNANEDYWIPYCIYMLRPKVFECQPKEYTCQKC